MKKSISKRLFIITFGIIIFLTLFTMIFQITFFQEFYYKRKSNDLSNAVLKFRALYSYDIKNTDSLYRALSLFELENNAKIGIYSIDSTPKYVPDPANKNSEAVDLLNDIFNELYSDQDFAKTLLNSNSGVTTEFKSRKYSTKYIVYMVPFSLNSKNDSIIIAITSFQAIEEASALIKDFYKYIILIVIVIGLILSYVFSNLISKPLVKLNKSAKKMSAMDFSEKCDIEREDEIGNLAKTLNFLSKNLSNALDDLKIKNKKLEEDIEKERELEKLRKDFIAGASHELKTPIGIISGYAEGIKDGIVDHKDQGVYLDIIIDEAEKMNKLVMDMLELSKLEAGKIDLHIIDFSLTELTEEVLVKNSVEINKNNLTVIKNYSPTNDLYVQGDDFKIEQVLTNFVTNAIKYSEPNNQIIIDIKPVEEDKIYFSIENTGAHIPDSDINKIWTQFYRGDTSRNRGSRSTGLGLSIVKNLLQAHESEFGVMNTENGVKFYFTLKKSKEIDEVEEI
ncbi:HAMP domain-containing histidine kinase [Clostridium perfringens]|uniref:HAMP domain-containing sensor histidine kinase n=1 Tax=Clostridium perfringens TaxID=1502 RepID=UPI001A1B50EA|nr:HAMP domain-containing sensor histidine kinase [Clostridium perfringens]UBK68150.1 HAMP domain-containing histidine kinase [Clostridium perfringens]UBK70737.1 HAMP domain-containing histidine kinase [Clostridium perfringens]HAT4132844.1 HAMP domain-containing histidine kinase [Clostridium perfringens]HAT4148057.1 HAMP domain-containing histidine kinase [Clostridium perfringens]HAT4229134.1 HAMP domain-containing histidine kinase [Clostridium perfringens]